MTETSLYAFRRNVVLVASAGTGKTHALVGVLLHALLGVSELHREPIDPARVAATTFSRKAAAEIHERLVTELERLAFGDTSTYQVDLDVAAGRLGVPWSAQTRRDRALRSLAGVERATIATLHALAYATVRQHALAVGLAPSLDAASEDDNEAWANEAVTGALDERATRDMAGIRDLFRLVRGRERAEEELVRLLLALDEDGRAASELVLPEGDSVALDTAMRDIAEANGVRDAYDEGDLESLTSAIADSFAERSIRGDEARRSLRDGLGSGSHRERAATLVHGWAAREGILPTAALIREVLASAQTRFAELHARNGAVGFGAALRLARDALRDDPVAAAHASAAYDALLVDEFQDTSRVQVELVRLLWERAPRDRTPGAMPLFGDLRPKGLLVVGDRKQSIYAFRGADVGVFVATCVELAGDRARVALGIPDGVVPTPMRATADFFVLRENHRANAALIDFANTFSRECLTPESDELFEARYVEDTESLLPAATTLSVEQRVTWLRPSGKSEQTPKLDDGMLAATYIAEAAGRDLTDEGEPLAFRDFAILAQSGEMLDAAAFAMARFGIPHVVAGRGFFAAREVQDMLSLLRWMERPSDRVSLLAVLRGPLVALGDRTLLALTEPHRGLVTAPDRWGSLERHALAAADDRDALDHAQRTLRALARAAERLGPGRTLREAVRAFDVETTLLLMPRGAQRVANVRKLMRMADEAPTTRVLLERVARAEARAREPEAATFAEDDDAVRLLTIHASKGLAFRVVIIPELRASTIRSQSATMGVDLRSRNGAWLATKVLDGRGEPVSTPSLRTLVQLERARLRADRRRLMYVAVTRARERLVFVGDADDARAPSFGAIVAQLASTGLVAVRACDAADASVRAIEPRSEVALSPVRAPRTTEITMAPTALQDFGHCARRFELVHLVRLPEPTPRALGRFRADGHAEADARAEGDAVHALLERIDLGAFGVADAARHAREALALCDVRLDDAARDRVVGAATRFLESDFARTVRGAAEIHRERAFVVTIAGRDMTLTLRGAMDLVVVWRNGDVDVVDYKSARGPNMKPYELQLDVYAYAMQREGGDAHRVRAGAMFLGSAMQEPRFRPPTPTARLEARLTDLATKLVAARSAKTFHRAGEKTCHDIGCGYFSLCHPPRERRQLTLFR